MNLSNTGINLDDLPSLIGIMIRKASSLERTHAINNSVKLIENLLEDIKQ